MKTLSWIVLAAILVPLFGIPANASVEAPVGSYASRIACTNMEASEPVNKIVIELYNGNADSFYTKTDNVPLAAGYTRIYTLTDTAIFPGLSGFTGAATVSASRKVACAVTTERSGSGIGSFTPARSGSYTGSDTQLEAGSTVYAPQTLKNLGGWNSYIAIRNNDFYTGSVQVSFIDRFLGPIPAATVNISVPPQNTTIVDQETAPNLPVGFLGTAKIVGTTEGNSSRSISLTASIVIYQTGGTNNTAQYLAYNGFISGASKLYVPRFVRKYTCYNGGLTIQNFSSSATTVQLSFVFNGVSYSWSETIGGNGIKALYAPDITQLNGVDGYAVPLRVGSGTIQVTAGTGPIAAIVNEDNRGQTGACTGGACGTCEANQEGYGSTYSAIPDGSQKNALVFPQLQRKVGSTFSSGWTIQNTSSSFATCTAIYRQAGLANVNSGSILVSPGSQYGIFLPNVTSLQDGFNGSVIVTCDQPIFGIGNTSARSATSYLGDSYSTYNGIGN